ncbi:tyrosinase [Lentinula edodes]|uniref:Tyrosinase n=1 Tax=Lentinula edodes TaxID=5353 RepID=A0A1Q3E543_LENED|nr:tyrosinase [Lentinula edodes]
MSHYLVTGATGGSTSGATAPNRLEINDFVKQEDQFSLYIQALQYIYSSKSQDDIDSFFQIGGIHGLPYVPWDGAGNKPVDTDAWEGYCTHGSVLFPTFHRPYVLLIEQAIQAAAVDIAATYIVDRARYQDAALNLRQPYWDWARNPVPPPEVISLDEVTIVNPSGEKISVPNPLRRYTFHPIDPSFPEPYQSWSTTLRHPLSDDANASDNVPELKATLRSAGPQLKTKTYNLLTRVHTWPAFSNHTPDDGGSTSNSLEGIHDSVHVDVGGNGQMSDPSVAGFDPIFFMHHAQVDRLLSLWSALNPRVWITDGPSGDGTWTIPPDTVVGKDTDLTPFWNTQSSYWISANVTDTRFHDWQCHKRCLFAPVKIASTVRNNEQKEFWEWTARVQVKKYEIGGSFKVLFFLGSVPSDPKEWATDPHFVGAFHGFVNSSAERCANCRRQQDVVLEGFVHLNEGIANISNLNSFDPIVVEPYLKENFHWRVQKVSGEVVNLDAATSLEVVVVATRLELPPGEIFPRLKTDRWYTMHVFNTQLTPSAALLFAIKESVTAILNRKENHARRECNYCSGCKKQAHATKFPTMNDKILEDTNDPGLPTTIVPHTADFDGSSFGDRSSRSKLGGWKGLSRHALRWGIETHGIAPTSEEERTDTRMWQMFTVWFSAILNLTGMSTGALGPIFFSLDFRECIIVLVVADIICCLVPAYFVVFGPKLGTRTMVQSRFSFGYYGAMLISTLNVFSQIGWLIINSIVGGQVLAAVSTKLNDTTGIVIIVLISFVLSFCGYKTLHWYETYIWLPSVVLFIALLGVGGNQLVAQIPILISSTPAAAAVDHTHVEDFLLGLCRYLHLCSHIIGAAFASAAPAIPSWETGLGDGEDFGRFLVAILEPIGNFGKFLVVLGALTVTAPCAITMYSFGVSLMSISPMFAKVPRYIYSLICTAIVIPIAIVGATHFFTAFEDVLNLIGYWATSYASIVLCEHFLFRKNDFARYSVVDWNTSSNLPLGVAAILAFLCSFAVIVPSMNQPWYTGPIANAGTGDIGLITGFFASGLLYMVFRAVEVKFSARRRNG